MSQFDDELKKTVSKVKGAKAALLMGFDGIAVAEVNEDLKDLPIQDIAIEFTVLLGEATKIAQGNSLGALNELTVSAEAHRIIFRVIDSTYFLALFLDPQETLGQGRFALRQLAPVLKELL